MPVAKQYLAIKVGAQASRLNVKRTTRIMQTVNQGHTINLAIIYVDGNGNPMQVTPVPDSPPVWKLAFGIVTIVVAPNGLTAVVSTPTLGTDSVGLTVIVGGKTFTANLTIQVVAVPQVLTAVQIAATVV